MCRRCLAELVPLRAAGAKVEQQQLRQPQRRYIMTWTCSDWSLARLLCGTAVQMTTRSAAGGHVDGVQENTQSGSAGCVNAEDAPGAAQV